MRADGTVVAAGDNGYGQCNVGAWREVVAIACDDSRTVGVRADGTVVAVGRNDYGQCNVSGWKLFSRLDTIAQERAMIKRREERKAALAQERAALQAELANLKGLFSGKRRKELEARLTEIDNEWKGLN